MVNAMNNRQELYERRRFLSESMATAIGLATASFANRSWRACGEENNTSEETTGTEMPAKRSLLVLSHWARIDVSLGQIQTICIPSAQTRMTTSGMSEGSYYEKLTISGETDTPSVRYEAKDEQRNMSIHVINGNNVTLTQSPNGPNGAPVTFTQSPFGKMILRVGMGDSLQEFPARNIWHLLLREPDTCNQLLMPLLDACIASNHLMQDAHEIQIGLLNKAGTPHVSRMDMSRYVYFLGSEKSEVRRSGIDKLSALGISALPYLESLNLAAMDNRGQRKHVTDAIREIRRRYTHCEDVGSRPDTVERVTLWLFEDPIVWSNFLKGADTDLRAIVLKELQAMFPHLKEAELLMKYDTR